MTHEGDTCRSTPVVKRDMPADCEINKCGVTATGRCSTCGLAFCTSHRSTNLLVLDLCGVCHSNILQERQEAISGERERFRSAHKRIVELAAALREIGVAPQRHYCATKLATNWLGFTKEIEDPQRHEYGWDLGTYPWVFVDDNGHKRTEPTRTVVSPKGGVYQYGVPHISRVLEPMSYEDLMTVGDALEVLLEAGGISSPPPID